MFPYIASNYPYLAAAFCLSIVLIVDECKSWAWHSRAIQKFRGISQPILECKFILRFIHLAQSSENVIGLLEKQLIVEY
jgi:hypothetical protein